MHDAHALFGTLLIMLVAVGSKAPDEMKPKDPLTASLDSSHPVPLLREDLALRSDNRRIPLAHHHLKAYGRPGPG